MSSGPVAGGRESRRIVGDYELTEEDVRTGARHSDVIVLGAWRLDQHPAGSAGYHDIAWIPPYDISFRTLLPRDFDNLLVAGRCHSATSGALASSRVTATAMGMGQAAGDASLREMNMGALQTALRDAGAILQAPASDVEVGDPDF